MSKLESLTRQRIIINTLRNKPASFKEIKFKLETESEIQSRNLEIGIRTFQRDIKEIEELYGLEIVNNRTTKMYALKNDENQEMKERILESFDIVNMLNISSNLGEYIYFEQRKPQGTEHIHLILQSIQNRKLMNFVYTKFWNEKPTSRLVEPLALREFKSRWYLVANDLKDNTIKTFALDRLTQPEVKSKSFKYPSKDVLTKKFAHCFGVITPDKGEPEKILLSFTPFQAKYVKTMPLHHSQKIVEESKKKCVIELTLFPTYDFIMELLSLGKEVKVLIPKSLAKEVVKAHKEAIGRYS